MKILTTDFTENELTTLHTPYLEAAKRACSDKITFFQAEINSGRSGMVDSHIINLKLYVCEFIKWVEIVRAAKKRDADNESYFGTYLGDY